LWNLLDVIHRRTSRLADEIDNYQKFSNRNIAAGQSAALTASSGSGGASSFQSQLNYVSKENMHHLRKERDSMMDKMGDMEAEVLATRIKESKLQEQIMELHETKAELEEKLKAALSHKYELQRHNEFDVAR
jgi:septal ring factor EnvC (AmiA/AmiB activator)